VCTGCARWPGPVESERFAERLVSPLKVLIGILAEFLDEPVDPPEARPGRRVIRIIVQTLEVEVARQPHVLEGPRRRNLVGAKIKLVPRGTGGHVPFTITVENLGSVYNEYSMLAE
jgi:hypothetical protein